MSKQTVLIFGSAGMLGQSLMDAFPGAIGLDRDGIDITDPAQVKNTITKIKPTVVINAAAFNDVDACETDEAFAAALKLNGAVPGSIAAICAQYNSTFVHYSTNYVFAGENEVGYCENDDPSPINRYGESKLAGERAVQQGFRNLPGRFRKPSFYIIRTSKLFGAPGSSPAAKKSFFDTMLQLSAARDALQAVDDELGNFTYTPDLAHYTKELIENNYPSGIYHGVNEHPATWFAGARVLFDISQWSGRLTAVAADVFPRAAKRPQCAALLNTRGPAMRGYEEALKEFIP